MSSAHTSTQVLVADDHQLVRSGIAALLSAIPGIEVVAQAADGEQALQLSRKIKPDVLFLDLVMPKLSGLDVLNELHQTEPDIRVIILSMHATEEHVLHALRHGAAGYMIKDVAPEELPQAIEAVMRGDRWLSAPLSNQVIDGYMARTHKDSHERDILTERQLQVLKLIGEGLGTREIADRLSLSVKTIETYRAQIMARLKIHEVAGLVRYAICHGLVSL